MNISTMDTAEVGRIRVLPDAGFGAISTDRGNLPLDRLDVHATITGLVAHTVVTTEFVNVHDSALEATYIFPLPDRAAVTGMTMTAGGRTVEAELRERAAAREAYDEAVAAGRRASIAEEDRPDVFSLRVGNILAGERVTVELRLAGPLPYEDGAATFRFPLVVAPRYVPGAPLPGPSVGDGQVPDTDAVPDASRITPPVLLPGMKNPLRLSLGVQIDPAGLILGEVRSSLHTVSTEGGHVSLAPGERADRDFVLRLAYAPGGESAVAVPDPDDARTGTYQVTVVPPAGDGARAPKDVVLLLDRSGSMGGWKMVAARRAAARVVDTLTGEDRFAVLTFDHDADRPAGLDEGLVPASDRHRYRAVEHLSRVTARGGTELLAPLRTGLELLRDPARDRAATGAWSSGRRGEPAPLRDRVLVLVTDGQVGNEDQILHEVAPLIGTTRVHTIGIDRAVNAGFLGRLAAVGGGRTELVESEDRLDQAMEAIHRRIGAPVVTDLSIDADGLTPADGTRSPHRLPGLYPGVPLVVSGRYSGEPGGTVTVTGRTRDDGVFRTTIPVVRRDDPAITVQWARARLRDLEDRYAAGDRSLEKSIVETSLRFGVLCRFTAYLAVDARVVTEGGPARRVTQPVELPSGWEAPLGDAAPAMTFLAGSAAPPPLAAPAPPMRPRFAPVTARGRYSRAPAADTAMTAGGGAAPRTFLPPRPPRPVPVLDLAGVARLEADRLRAARDEPPHERRLLLDDLAARLTVLLAGRTGDDVAPLHRLLAVLTGGDDLDTRWAEALRVLGEFGGTARDRGQFWKR